MGYCNKTAGNAIKFDKSGGAHTQREIVKCGYVVAAGSFVNGTDRFAMLLIDQKHLVDNPPMYAFTLYDNGHRIQLFNYDDGEQAVTQCRSSSVRRRG